jgi:hypothetical protein
MSCFELSSFLMNLENRVLEEERGSIDNGLF